MSRMALCIDELDASLVILMVFAAALGCGGLWIGARILKGLSLADDPRMPSVGKGQRVVLATLALASGGFICMFLLAAILWARPCA